MSRKLAAVIAAMVLCLTAAPVVSGAPPSPFPAGSSGLGDPYFPLDGNGGYDVQHYDLALSYEPATDRLTGIATITARATQNLSAFNLDFIGMRLRSLTVNGASAKTSRKGQELTVKPAAGLSNGSTFTVVARYDGVPEPIFEEGLGDLGFLPTEDGAIVQGEPHVAATWFPANDHPRDKASFAFHITIPTGLEAIANGVLVNHQSNGALTTWNWNAAEPMVPYLAMMVIDDLEMRDYIVDGVAYWDAIDADLMEAAPSVTPVAGSQFIWSQAAEPAFKRLTRTISVPTGGATVTFQVNRDTESDFDFLFVESRTAGGTDWTTLPDLNGHTANAIGACPYITDVNPFLLHYLTPVVVDPGDPADPDDDEVSCEPTGSTGAWNAISGTSDGWESWSVRLADAAGAPRQVELSISYASDFSVQGRGVIVDEVVVSSGPGTTGFEPDGDTLDGWSTPAAPDPNQPNENTWAPSTFVPAAPGPGAGALVSFDRQPEIIAWEGSLFGAYPWTASGGVVQEGAVGFALENQTRPVYSPFFFGDEGNDFVVVHELAHQWFGDLLAVDTWKETWLNEGFATYAEWMWGEHEGFFTPQDIYDDLTSIPADEGFWDLALSDPGIPNIFAGEIYDRGALTLHALRLKVGDKKFFEILRGWVAQQAGGTVSTREFIDLAESIYKKDLDPLFAEWLSSGKPASLEVGHGNPNARGHAGKQKTVSAQIAKERAKSR
jgi:hypothetical protein